MLDINEQLLCIQKMDFFHQLSPITLDKDILYAVIKGDVLSVQSYGKLNARRYSDIDILTTRDDLAVVEQRLRENGFSNNSKRTDRIALLANSHQISPWGKNVSPWGRLEVDLNFDIFWGEYEGKRIDIKEFLSDTVEMDIYGVKVRTLSPIKAMIQLVLHHYKDMNSIFLLATRNSITYDMFKDVYYLLMNNLDAISLDRLYVMGEEYGVIPYLFYVLYYTGQLFDDKILKQYIESFRTSEGESLLNYYGLCAKERKEWRCNFKTRLETQSIYNLIKDDLTEKDHCKISINKRIFAEGNIYEGNNY